MADIRELLSNQASAFRPSNEALELTLGRVHRRQRNRRVLAGVVAAVMAAAGLGGAYLAFGVAGGKQRPAAESPGPCLSEDEPGLITCQEALQRADEEEGRSGASGIEARLDWYSARPGEARVRVWVVTYQGVQLIPLGRPGSAPACIVDDWDVVIDATTGDFLVAGNAGRPQPCPSATGEGIRVGDIERLLQPAPRDCFVGLVHADAISPEEVPGALHGHLLTGLPDGFGLRAAWTGGGFDGMAMWSDERCREITLTLGHGDVSDLEGPPVGSWTVFADELDGCENPELGTARCLDYVTEIDDGVLTMQFVGMEREEADPIVLSVVLDG
jgi:hypothetical protein